MNRNFKVIIFVLLLGSITSFLLLGAKALTEDRIAQNADIKLKSAVLDGFGISYNTQNVNDVFDQEVQVISYQNDTTGNVTFYVDQVSGAVSFEYSGGGVWDTISGVITLESDMQTIRKVAVLYQAETPGLGAVVATPQYLDTFVGVLMVP